MKGRVNVSSVPQRSPFRYPGGKTWLVPLFRRWMFSLPQPTKSSCWAFCWCGIISLTAAFEHLADSVVMVELDDQIAAVWQTILAGNAQMAGKTNNELRLITRVCQSRICQISKVTMRTRISDSSQNRTAHVRILAEGAGVLKNGENGKAFCPAWYPQTLAKRITNIEFIADRLEFIPRRCVRCACSFSEGARSLCSLWPANTLSAANVPARGFIRTLK